MKISDLWRHLLTKSAILARSKFGGLAHWLISCGDQAKHYSLVQRQRFSLLHFDPLLVKTLKEVYLYICNV